MRKLSLIFLAFWAISCSSSKGYVKPKMRNSSTYILTEISTDPTYGYTVSNPVKVGGVKKNEGPLNERRFLNALTGPNGEEVSYYRKGSCCVFKTRNGYMGSGLLDLYKVSWEGATDTFSIYINMYDFGPLKAPKGFGLKK